jgi:hypothetical protein
LTFQIQQPQSIRSDRDADLQRGGYREARRGRLRSGRLRRSTYTRSPARKIAITLKTNVVSGKSVPGAFPPLLEPPPPPGSEKLDNPAADAFFLPLPLPPLLLLPPPPLPALLPALPPDAVDGETVEEPELPALPPPPPEPPWWCPVGLMSGMYCSTAAWPNELDAATSIPTVARTSAGKIARRKTLDAPVNIAIILARSLGPEGSN